MLFAKLRTTIARRPRALETRRWGATPDLGGVRRGSVRVLALALLVSVGLAAVQPSAARGQDLPYKPFMELTDWAYVPASQGGGKQTIRLRFDFSPDLPLGTKIQMDLLHNGLEVEGETVFYDFSENKRKGVRFDWKPKEELAVDKYLLQVQIPWEQQTDAVRKAITQKAATFPKEFQGWLWTFGTDKEVIHVGTPEEAAAQAKLTCNIYSGYIDELIDNMTKFVSTMEEVKEGKKFATGGQIDEKALTAYIKEWRIQQGKTQSDIRIEFPTKHRAIHARTLTAHQYLLRLAQMVSKRAVEMQRELTQANNIADINPVPDPKKKEERFLSSFDWRYRYKVSNKSLNDTLDRIYALVCPPAEEEKPKDDEKKPADGESDEKKPKDEDSDSDS